MGTHFWQTYVIGHEKTHPEKKEKMKYDKWPGYRRKGAQIHWKQHK
jgi:hypothetical protein